MLRLLFKLHRLSAPGYTRQIVRRALEDVVHREEKIQSVVYGRKV